MTNNKAYLVVEMGNIFSDFDTAVESSVTMIKDFVSIKNSSLLTHVFRYFCNEVDLDIAVERYLNEHVADKFYSDLDDEGDPVLSDIQERCKYEELGIVRELIYSLKHKVMGEILRIMPREVRVELMYFKHQYVGSILILEMRYAV